MTSSSTVKVAHGHVTRPNVVSQDSRSRTREGTHDSFDPAALPDVIEANSVLFQLCSRGDMLSSGATRNSGVEVKVGRDTGDMSASGGLTT